MKVDTLSADTTLVETQSGTTFWLDNSTGETVTLPALKNGLYFKFVVADSFATDNWIIDSAEGDNINGTIVVNGANIAADGEDQINFVASAESEGDYIELECNGTYWLVSGMGQLAGSITATDPS
jgi:hypothetical protein